MAIEYWLYGNANYADSRLQEFQLRLYSGKLEEQRDELIELSRRMMSVQYRKEHRTEKCWFAGRLRSGDDQFAVALAGEQNTLLGTQYRGSRGMFCMMALVFSGEDKGLYMQEEDLFEPLKTVMRKVNENEDFCKNLQVKGSRLKDDELEEAGLKDVGLEEAALQQRCTQYRMQNDGGDETGNFNILTSTPETNEKLWMASQHRPIVLNVLSWNDAEKLLVMFPDSLISVIGAANEFYKPQKKLSAIQKRRMAEQMEKRPSRVDATEPYRLRTFDGQSRQGSEPRKEIKEKIKQKTNGEENLNDHGKHLLQDNRGCKENHERFKNDTCRKSDLFGAFWNAVSQKGSESCKKNAHVKTDWKKVDKELCKLFELCMGLGDSAGVDNPETFAKEIVYEVLLRL